jgi:hypothetical protein
VVDEFFDLRIAQERPVGVLSGEGEAAVMEAEEVLLFVVDVRRTALPNLPEFHL